MAAIVKLAQNPIVLNETDNSARTEWIQSQKDQCIDSLIRQVARKNFASIADESRRAAKIEHWGFYWKITVGVGICLAALITAICVCSISAFARSFQTSNPLVNRMFSTSIGIVAASGTLYFPSSGCISSIVEHAKDRREALFNDLAHTLGHIKKQKELLGEYADDDALDRLKEQKESLCALIQRAHTYFPSDAIRDPRLAMDWILTI